VAEALHDLHRQRVIHLDIKPSNVLLRPDGTAVLIDFGLSRHDDLPDLLEESFQLPMGTGPYMSPEQVQYVRSDPRSDLFALGVMLYQFTTGERPFGAPSSVRGLRKRLYVEPVPPRDLRPDCPPWLQEIILKCLEVRPDKRYQSAAQLALALSAPDQVPLTARAQRHGRSSAMGRLRRWFFAVGSEPDAAQPGATAALNRSPIIVVAVDTESSEPDLLVALRETVQRLVLSLPGARLACVSILRTARIGMDERVDRQGQSLHVKKLVQLKHWARPIGKSLGLDEGRLTYHVLEAPDPAAAVIDFAQRGKVDQIVMGARGSSALRRYLGSVSSQVVAAADCTVTVVRVPARAGAESDATPTGRDDGA
jgi:nucleotide-binding universal stress UspA family protein